MNDEAGCQRLAGPTGLFRKAIVGRDSPDVHYGSPMMEQPDGFPPSSYPGLQIFPSRHPGNSILGGFAIQIAGSNDHHGAGGDEEVLCFVIWNTLGVAVDVEHGLSSRATVQIYAVPLQR